MEMKRSDKNTYRQLENTVTTDIAVFTGSKLTTVNERTKHGK